MAHHGWLKVALEDQAGALQRVTDLLHDVTGLTAQPEFQEIDHPGQLLVEVRLPDAGGYTPPELAQRIRRRTRELHVLSAWNEPPGPLPSRTRPCQVVDVPEDRAGDLAVRAHRDGLPTARWHRSSPTQVSHWLLAVPGTDSDRRTVVGIWRRPGYYYRFSAAEATSLILTPTAA